MPKIRGKQRINILVLISSYLMLFLIYTVWRYSPADSYELSIYSAFPTYFWIILSIIIMFSLLVIIVSTHMDYSRQVWLGLFLILSIYTMILLLPVIRGYVLPGRGTGDILVHIGHAKTIIDTGHIYNTNYYPVIHILMASLNHIGLSLETASALIWTTFSIGFIIFITVLARKIIHDRKKAFFVIFFSLPLMFYGFHIAILPAFFSFFMIPLLLYTWYATSSKKEFLILYIVLSFLIVFFHPMTTLILIMIFMIFLICDKLPLKKYFKNIENLDFRIGLSVFLISYVTWIISFERGVESIERIILWPFVGQREAVIEHHTGLVSRAGLGVWETFSLFTNRFGVTAIYLLIPLLLILFFIFKGWLKTLNTLEVSSGLQYLGGISFIGYSVVGYMIEFGPVRSSRYAVLFSIILMGALFYKTYTNVPQRKKLYVILIVFIIVFSSSLLCIFNIDGSPRNFGANSQLSHSEHDGWNWYINNRNESVILYCTSDLRKYEIYIQGRYNYSRGAWSREPIPTRFGYEENYTMYESFNETSYMVTKEFNRVSFLRFPEQIHELTLRYLEEDFVKLESDPTVNKIYENDGYEVWMVKEN